MSVQKKSFRQAVLAAVLGGASSVDEVLDATGHLISPARAAGAMRREAKNSLRRGRRGKMPPLKVAIARGRQLLVGNQLVRLAKEGLITRVGRGRYAPPTPKLFHPQAG